MRFRKIAFLPLAVCGLFSSAASRAQTAVYTFESPVFTLGQTTSLLNVGPNAGDLSFTASFTSAPGVSGYSITNMPENALISGQSLAASISTDPLTITFNKAVTQLSFAYAINAPATASGSIKVTTAGGAVVYAASNVGGTFAGGTVTLNSAAGLTSLQLSAYPNTVAVGLPTQLDIDNLTVTFAVPEPGSVALLTVSALAGAGFLIRRRKQARPAA